MSRDRAQLDFLRWLSVADPRLYREATAQTNHGLGSLGWVQLVVQAVAMVGSAVMAKKQQKKAESLTKQAIAADQASQEAARKDAMKIALLDTNAKRAAMGLGPVNEAGQLIGAAQLPPVPSNLAPYYGAQATAQANALSQFGDKKLWLIGGAALLGGLFIIRSRS